VRARGAGTPVHNLGFVDDEALIVRCGQTWSVTDRAIDIGECAAQTAHGVMVVIPDSGLESGGGAGGFDAAQDPSLHQGGERVVDPLPRNRAQPGTDRVDYGIGCGVGLVRDRFEYG